MIDCQSFLLGMKPAIYGNTESPSFMKHMDSFEKYPCVTDNIDLFDGPDFYLFFQSDNLKGDFLKKLNQVKPRSAEFHKILGLALGYPPLAVEYYSKCHQLKMLGKEKEYQFFDQYRVAIRYAGIRCTCHVNDLVENAIWLWGHYRDIKKLEIGIEFETYPVNYNDTNRLNEVKRIKLDQIKEIIHT